MKYVFSALIIVCLASCGGKKQDEKKNQPPPAVAVSVTRAKDTAAVYFDEYPATVTALTEVEIRPQVSGYITGIYFQEGQHVTKGQKLYAIDQQQYRGQYEQAVANLNVAKAEEARAQQDLERYQQLAKQDAIARQVLEHSEADLNTAKSQVAAQKANVAAVETGLKYSTISSPITGTIGISQVKYGASVTPGSTILNIVSSDNPMAVDFSVDEKELQRFVQLEKKGTNPADSIFTISLPGDNLYPLTGQIYLIDRAIDPQTGTIKIRLTFPNKDLTLRPGMTCNVRVKSNAEQKQILIPYKSVVEQMGEYFVYTVGDSSKAYQKKVVVGRRIGEDVIIKSGLEGNETVITDGVQKVKEGVQVTTGNPAAAKSPQAAGNAAGSTGSGATADSSKK